MKSLTLPISILCVSASAAFAEGDEYQFTTFHTLNQVTIDAVVTTMRSIPATPSNYQLVEQKFSNKELLEELVSRGLIPSIKGYDVVEFRDDWNASTFHAYNRKTQHSLSIPSDLLHYEDNVVLGNGVSAWTEKDKDTNKIVSTIMKMSDKGLTSSTIAGADGHAFYWVDATRTSYNILPNRTHTYSEFMSAYRSEIFGFSAKDSENELDDYTVNGIVKSGNGRLIDPALFSQPE